MARIYTEGFESKSAYFLNYGGAPASSAVVTANPRSGLYSFYHGNNTEFYIGVTTASEYYIRVCMNFKNNMVQPLLWRNAGTLLGRIAATSTGRFAAYVSTTLVATGTIPFNSPGYTLLELRVYLDNAAGKIQTKVDGVLDIDYTGDTLPAAALIDNIGFGGDYTYMDDLAINSTSGAVDNSWCGDGHIIALKPNANGDSSQFEGSDGNSTDNYLLVDEIPGSMTDYVRSSVSGDKDLYGVEDAVLGGTTISRVWVEALANKNVAGTRQVYLGVKSGGTESWSTAQNLFMSDRYYIKSEELLTNPADSGAWEDGDIDAIQIGVKVV